MDWHQKYPAAGIIRGHRRTLIEWLRLRKRRKRQFDLQNVRGWCG